MPVHVGWDRHRRRRACPVEVEKSRRDEFRPVQSAAHFLNPRSCNVNRAGSPPQWDASA